jgi:hypothetical protein
MKKELFEKLKNKYPLLSNIKDIECDNGWLNLVSNLTSMVEDENSRVKNIQILQIKEKFGGLRYYISNETQFISGAICLAELLSFNICEICGNSGTKRNMNKGWLKTICDNCFKS